ncbi:MAG: hypothetical protein C5S48_05635 [Candidatus Methanogaster sp.]|nr:MAG: hypothetical protein C5S48_05635 [ANME-2 cluster archaeon]
MKCCLLRRPLLCAYCSFLRISILRAFPSYSATGLVIAAMSGCIDDAANDAENATRGDASNDTNTTLANAGDELSSSETKEPINESGAKMGDVPEFNPEPEVEAVAMGHKNPNITVEMNETVNQSGLNVTCIMVKNYQYRDEGTDWRLESSVRHTKLCVAITVAGGEEVDTGMKDWRILDARGRRYQMIPHTDINPMKPVHKLSDGDTVNAHLLFDIPGNITDFSAQYNISNVVSSDCGIISWVVGDPGLPAVPWHKDGFVRYPIKATGSYYHTSNRTWVSDDLTFHSDGRVEFDGTHLHGLGTWELVESYTSCNAYNITFKDQFYNVNIDVLGSWSSNGCGMGKWNKVKLLFLLNRPPMHDPQACPLQ